MNLRTEQNENTNSAISSCSVLSSERQELINPILTSVTDGSFKRLNTVPVFSIHLAISIVISMVGIILAVSWPEEKRCSAYFIMLYFRVIFWIITFLFYQFISKLHKVLRMVGYHEFYRATAIHKSMPLYIVSLWNSMLLGVQTLIHHYYGNLFWEHCVQGFLSPITYITAFNVVESTILALTHCSYIVKVMEFNKSANQPDALRGGNTTGGSIGLVHPEGSTAELLEKQADLIAYLQDHNEKLSKKLHNMQLSIPTVNTN